MKFLHILLTCLFVAVLYCDDTFEYNEGIIITDDSNFEIARQTYKRLLVNFDGGCKWCRNFRPSYLAACKQGTDEGYEVKFAQLDLKSNPKTQTKYNVTGHPKQWLFVLNDRRSPYKYPGSKNKDKLLAWLKQKIEDVKARGY